MMKIFFLIPLLLWLVSYGFVQGQTVWSTVPVSLDKAEYDDREAVSIKQNDSIGLFLNDNVNVVFQLLNNKGELINTAKTTVPSNYSSLKRVGTAYVNHEYLLLLAQGNKKIWAFAYDVRSNQLSYRLYYNAEKDHIITLAAGVNYVHILTYNSSFKNELNIHTMSDGGMKDSKYTSSEVDLLKFLDLSSSKAIEQIACIGRTEKIHFNRSYVVNKIYHSQQELWLVNDVNTGSSTLFNLLDASKSYVIKDNAIADKKNKTTSIIYKNALWQLNVSSLQYSLKAYDIENQKILAEYSSENNLMVENLIESSYTYKTGYTRTQTASHNSNLIKLASKALHFGLGIVESKMGNDVLLIGAVNTNNLSDPSIENAEMTQTSSINMVVLMERPYHELHTPSYNGNQQALLSFKKEIWSYVAWSLNDVQLSKNNVENYPVVEDYLETYYRDPVNNSAPAVIDTDTYLFGFYGSKSHVFTIQNYLNKKTNSNVNRR